MSGRAEELIQTIRADVQKLIQNVNQLQSINQQIKGKDVSMEIRDKIFKTEEIIKSLMALTNKNLQELSKNPAARFGEFKIQKERLTDELIKTMTKYKTVIQSTVDMLEKSKKQQSGFRNPILQIENESSNTVRYSNFNENESYYQQQQMQPQNQLESTKEREQQLKNLEKDIVDLNSMFKDLSVLVHEQGDTLNSIESNIDNTQDIVHTANVELSKGVKLQSKARSKKLCLIITLLLVLIGVTSVVLIVLHPWSK